MQYSPEDWRSRFRQQARWTESTRRSLVQQAGLISGSLILETGCGTGAITHWLLEETGAIITGVDLNRAYLNQARRDDRETNYCQSNALRLPFPDNTFDAVVCHYFLLWIQDPAAVLVEMARVAKAGASVMAFAEPDYGGRIDAPEALEVLGKLQAESLLAQGAAPRRGRELAGLFARNGLVSVKIGVMGGYWSGKPNQREIDLEWEMLEADLDGTIPAEELVALKAINQAAWESGERILYVPTFFTTGIKSIVKSLK